MYAAFRAPFPLPPVPAGGGSTTETLVDCGTLEVVVLYGSEVVGPTGGLVVVVPFFVFDPVERGSERRLWLAFVEVCAVDDADIKDPEETGPVD